MTKTSISFGLVHIPVTLKACVKVGDVGFNMIDRATKSRVKYEKTCVDCDGRIVRQEDIIKGFQYEKGKYVFFEDADFEKLKTQKDKTIAIEKFVALAEIDPIYYEKAYFVAPDKNSAKAFALLHAAMDAEKKVGIAKTVIGTKENLVALRVFGEGLVLNTMYFDDEVQTPDVTKINAPDEKELDMAVTIINNMSAKFDPAEYKDEYRERVLAAIGAKIDGQEIKPAKTKQTAQIINLMDALKATLAGTKKAQ